MEVCEFVFVHRSPNRPVCDIQLYNPHIYIAYLKVIKGLLPFFNCFPFYTIIITITKEDWAKGDTTPAEKEEALSP